MADGSHSANWAATYYSIGNWYDVPFIDPNPMHLSDIPWISRTLRDHIAYRTTLSRLLGASIVAAGWPMRALIGAASDLRLPSEKLFSLLKVQSLGAARRELLLPLKPIPLGFTVNTFLAAIPIFFAALPWRVLRARRRLKRGLCPQCGYDLRSQFEAGCSECGWKHG